MLSLLPLEVINTTYYECVFVTSVMQRAMRMRRVILSSMECMTVSYFSSLSHKRYDFRDKGAERKICVLIFCTTFV